jgi:hypothetical protein
MRRLSACLNDRPLSFAMSAPAADAAPATLSKILTDREVLYFPAFLDRGKMAEGFLLGRRLPMLATIKWNSRHSAREWVMMVRTLVVQLGTRNALQPKGESKPGRPLWKHFDDTHHWDSNAEEWVPNEDR